MYFSIFPGLGAGRVDGLGEAGRVGRLDVVAAALSGEILNVQFCSQIQTQNENMKNYSSSGLTVD